MCKVVIKSYPVNGGDCFLIKYKEKNIIIDTGFKKTVNNLIRDLKLMAEQGEKIDVLIITHIDNDHIGGAITLFENEGIINIEKIWHNGYLQIFDINNILIKLDLNSEIKIKDIVSANAPLDNVNNDEVGFKEAKSLEEILFKKKKAINEIIDGKAIHDSLKYTFEDADIEFRFLTPTLKTLDELKEDWSSVLKWNDFYDEKRNIVNMPKAFEFYYLNKKDDKDSNYQMSNNSSKNIDLIKLADSETTTDNSIINMSSISFVMRIEDINLLFLGDSTPDCVSDALERLLVENPEYQDITLMKVAHHGSKHNISNRLLSLIKVKSFLISTNGLPIRKGKPSKPDLETIAKLVFNSPKSTIYMNYLKTNYNLDVHSMIDNWNTKENCCIKTIFGDGIEPLIIEFECGVR